MERLLMIVLAGGLLVACENKKSVKKQETPTEETEVAAQPALDEVEEDGGEQADEASASESSFASSKEELLRAAFDAATSNDVDTWTELMPTEEQLEGMCPSHGIELASVPEVEKGAANCQEVFAGRLEDAREFFEKYDRGFSQESMLDEEAGAGCVDFEVHFFEAATYQVEDEYGIKQYMIRFPSIFSHDGQWGIVGAPSCGMIAPG